MTRKQKIEWLAKATADELLKQYVDLVNTDRFGCNAEDIELTHDEIIRRMTNK